MAIPNKDAVWKLQNIDPSYWDEYIATRPTYDDKIFQRVYEYHASHSKGWSDALDIGTGAGSALGPLTGRFEHVVASDNDPTSLAFAGRRHSAVPPENLSYTLSSGEDIIQHYLPGSFDLITCAETFPLLDTQTALDNAFRLLRPGGTLAIWFYGPPFFTETDVASTSQSLLDSLLDHNFRPVLNGSDDAAKASWKRAADGKASWLDYIPFSPDQWADVRRHKWNNQHARLSFWTPDACDFPVEPVSNVREEEAVTEEQDPTFWAREWDAATVRRFVKASFPKPRELTQGKDETMEGLLQRLGPAMGGEGVVRKLSWPAVLVLATKGE